MALSVGLDIGAETVRAVALARRGRRWEIRRVVEVSRHDENGVRKPLALVLATVDSRLRLKGRLRVANSQLKVMVRYLPTIPMPQDRLERLLRLEMQQQAGDAEELAADAQVLPIGGDEMFHCCAFAQPEEVRGLLAELEDNGIRPDRVSIGPVALGNVIATSQPMEDPDGYGLIVDIGAKTTSVVLQRGNDFQACRALAIGGDDFTEALAKEWQVRFERAEQAKVRGDVVAGAERPDDAAPPDGGIVLADSHAQLGAPRVDPADQVRPDADEEDGAGRRHAKTAAYDPAPAAGAAPDPLSARYEAGGMLRTSTAALSGDDASPAGEATPGPAPAAAPADTDPFSDPLAGVKSVAPATPAPMEARVPGVPTAFADRGDGDRLGDEFSAIDDEVAEAARAVAEEAAGVDPLGETRPGEDEPWRRHEDGGHVTAEAVPAAGLQTMRQAVLTMGPELLRTAERLVTQLNASLAWFQSQLKLRRITLDRVLLCGGSADLLGLAPYVERRLKVPCQLLDPTIGLGGDRPAQAHRYATAIGLALGETAGAFDFDVRPEALLRRRVFWSELVWPRVAVVLVLAAAAVAAVFFHRQMEHHARELKAFNDNAREYQDRKAELADLVHRRRGLRQDLNAIVSRLLGGRDMLMTIRNLKENAPDGLWCQVFHTTSLSATKVLAEKKEGTGSDPGALVRPTTGDAGDAPPGRGAGRGEETPGGGRGGEGRGEPKSRGAVLYDTLLDRGSLYLAGFVKPVDATEEMHEVFYSWVNKVVTWKRPFQPGEVAAEVEPLFRGYDILRQAKETGRDGSTEFVFEVRFDYTPAALRQVTGDEP